MRNSIPHKGRADSLLQEFLESPHLLVYGNFQCVKYELFGQSLAPRGSDKINIIYSGAKRYNP